MAPDFEKNQGKNKIFLLGKFKINFGLWGGLAPAEAPNFGPGGCPSPRGFD